MTEKIEKIASSLFDLESPVLQARNLAMAIFMMASGDEMRGEQGDALATVAKSAVEILEGIEAARQKTLRLALSERDHAPKPAAGPALPRRGGLLRKQRATLRIVDAVQPGDGGGS
jgi:hypothetical protein